MLISTCSFYFIFKVCLSAILDPCSFSGIPFFGSLKSFFFIHCTWFHLQVNWFMWTKRVQQSLVAFTVTMRLCLVLLK